MRAARIAGHGLKVALDRTLVLVEGALLSPKGRERLHATSVFALILAFGVASVDMLVTGGPELISSARAATAESPRVDLIAATSQPRDGEVQLAAASSGAAVIPEERVAQIEPQAPRPAFRPAVNVPDLADAVEPSKAEPETRDVPSPRIKADA
ncbi:MAG: hypothetical protein K2X34_08960 [Hyphomonadaceae bacterium]|nr:hypothetical protein [Hyphomonadaceae bacterium]